MILDHQSSLSYVTVTPIASGIPIATSSGNINNWVTGISGVTFNINATSGNFLEANGTQFTSVSYGGDIRSSGTSGSLIVSGIQQNSIANQPTVSGQVLVYNAPNNIQWETPPLPSGLRILNANSSVLTPGTSAEWYTMTGNSITLTPGTWMVNGVVDFGDSGTSPTYSVINAAWCYANGANSATQPASISTNLKAGQAALGTNNSVLTAAITTGSEAMQPILVATSSGLPIFLVPFATMTTATNARIATNVWAMQVSTATS